MRVQQVCQGGKWWGGPRLSIEEAEKRTEMDCLEEGWRENEGLGDRKWEDTGEGGGGGQEGDR